VVKTIGDVNISSCFDVTADGAYIFAGLASDEVVRISTFTSNIVDRISVDPHPSAFALSPDDSYLYVSNSVDHYSWDKITVIDVGPVPAPASVLLFGSGLLGLAGIRRKHNKDKS